MLEVLALQKAFRPVAGAPARLIVDVPAFSLAAGQQVALRGESGSGKTTFLHLLSGLLQPDGGTLRLEGQDLTQLSEAGRDRVRAEKIGYIFQTFNLLQGHSALENVLLGMAFGGKTDLAHAEALLARVGLADRRHHLPRQLSVGQQQRVALARALAHRPRLVLADEPTGNLDSRHAHTALALLRETAQEVGAALLLVSHDEGLLQTFPDVRDFAQLNRAASVPTP